MTLRTPFTIAEITISLRLKELFDGDWWIDDSQEKSILFYDIPQPALYFHSIGIWKDIDMEVERTVRLVVTNNFDNDGMCWMESGRYRVSSKYIGPIPVDEES